MEVSTAKVSVFWPAAAYIVLTFGEVLLYGTMLDLAYAAAPKSMKGFITACFLLTNTLGNFLNIPWTPMYGGSLTDEAAERGPLCQARFSASRRWSSWPRRWRSSSWANNLNAPRPRRPPPV